MIDFIPGLIEGFRKEGKKEAKQKQKQKQSGHTHINVMGTRNCWRTENGRRTCWMEMKEARTCIVHIPSTNSDATIHLILL